MNAGVRSCLQKMLDDCYADAPTKGKRVTIWRGKHKGKSGIVFWHGRNKFDRYPYQYMSWMQAAMSDARGTTGFRIGVETNEGDKFFTDASYTIEPCNKCKMIDKKHCNCVKKVLDNSDSMV